MKKKNTHSRQSQTRQTGLDQTRQFCQDAQQNPNPSARLGEKERLSEQAKKDANLSSRIGVTDGTAHGGHCSLVISIVNKMKSCPAQEPHTVTRKLTASKNSISALVTHRGYYRRGVVRIAFMKAIGFKTVRTFNLLKTSFL